MWTLSGFIDEISPDFTEQCKVAADLGLTHVEVRSAWQVNILDLDADQLGVMKKTLAGYDLRVSSIGSPIGKIFIDEEFGPHLERMRALTRVAEDADVILLHENEKEIYGDVPARCLDIVRSVGSRHLRLAWDPANFVQVGVRPYTDGYAVLRPHLEYIQIKDALAADGTVVPAGKGDGEVAETLRALRHDGFDGFFSLEPHLSAATAAGGFSGQDLFRTAWLAFTDLLKAQGIEYA